MEKNGKSLNGLINKCKGGVGPSVQANKPTSVFSSVCWDYAEPSTEEKLFSLTTCFFQLSEDIVLKYPIGWQVLTPALQPPLI